MIQKVAWQQHGRPTRWLTIKIQSLKKITTSFWLYQDLLLQVTEYLNSSWTKSGKCEFYLLEEVRQCQLQCCSSKGSVIPSGVHNSALPLLMLSSSWGEGCLDLKMFPSLCVIDFHELISTLAMGCDGQNNFRPMIFNKWMSNRYFSIYRPREARSLDLGSPWEREIE